MLSRHVLRSPRSFRLSVALPECVARVPVRRKHHPGVVEEAEHTMVPPKMRVAQQSYLDTYKWSIQDTQGFWDTQAKKYIHWERMFDSVLTGSFQHGDVTWFSGGKLNACVNAIDKHLPHKAHQTAIIWEGDGIDEVRLISYQELHREVCKISNALKSQGVRKGDFVTLYMPMIPELAMTMLACARIGAPHSVVFAGFSSHALADRIKDANSKWIVTADQGKRAGKIVPLKAAVDDAIDTHKLEGVENVFVFNRTGADVPYYPRDIRMNDLVSRQRPFCPAEVMDAEDTLFVLYTSGSTGNPKGLTHSTAGYLTFAAMTTHQTFDLRDGDVYACVADCGWITGHTYIVYGPLINGATTFMFESTPLHPDHGRYWRMVEDHKITQLYTSPTALRSLMKFGNDEVARYNRSSLRVLGTVGEPINFDAWKWYHDIVGEKRCTVVDTWWQTETGGHMSTSMPGKTGMKPGSCGFPMYGVDISVLSPDGKVLEGNGVEGILVVGKPWPGMARSILNDHQRYLATYMQPFPGYYFSGDGCKRDDDGFYWITGRVDDVINISGHRIGTAEVENALDHHALVAEAAVVGFAHAVKGEALACFVVLRTTADTVDHSVVRNELKSLIRKIIGPFATPDHIVITPDLPKTRSGKIMRRLLRKIVSGNDESQLGDISTLADPSVVNVIIQRFRSS